MRKTTSLPGIIEYFSIAIKNEVYGSQDETFGRDVLRTLQENYNIKCDFGIQRCLPDGKWVVQVLVELATQTDMNKLKRNLSAIKRDYHDDSVKILEGKDLCAVLQFSYLAINRLPEFAGTLH